MNAIFNDGDREEIIRNAIKSATDKNIKLCIQSWGIEWSDKKERWLPKKDQKCCALGCVVLECQDKLTLKNIGDWRSLALENILQCGAEWIQMFQRGFDGYPRADIDQNAFPYDLGFMLRDELVKDNAQLKIPEC
jgi:hypothetical protein